MPAPGDDAEEAGRLMRSLLFVPGDSERKLEKAFASDADVLIVDLEDSVAPANKQAARRIAADFIAARAHEAHAALYVRVNDLATGLTDEDLATLVPARPNGVMLPKSTGGQDVQLLSAKLRVHEAEAGLADGGIRILPIVTETAAAVFAASTYAGASARLAGLTWGAEDLSAALGAATNRQEDGQYEFTYKLARSLCLLGAHAAGVRAIDTICGNFRDDAGLRKEAALARKAGFSGKIAIHPDQVAAINEAFTPDAAELEYARRVVQAFEQAPGAGTLQLDGEMLDRPHLKRAMQTLALGGAA